MKKSVMRNYFSGGLGGGGGGGGGVELKNVRIDMSSHLVLSV